MKLVKWKTTIKPIQKSDSAFRDAIILEQEMLDRLALNEGASITLSTGLVKKTVRVSSSGFLEKETVQLTTDVWNDILLPGHPLTVFLYYKYDRNELKIGPVCAMLLQDHTTDRTGSFGNLTAFSQELSTYCEETGGLFYVFEQKDWKDDSVEGYIHLNHKWEKRKLPVPDVIYNRVHSRQIERTDDYQSFIQFIKKLGIPLFNDRFLNKWETHDILRNSPELIPYVPDTKLFDGIATIRGMLKDHETLYLKPVHGSQGRNIFKISLSDIGFLLDYSTMNGEVIRDFPSLQSLYQSLRQRLPKQRFIIQQGLELMTFQGRPLDFRILCHMTKPYTWKVTSLVARVSEEDQFVSNVARGGELMSIDDVLVDTNDQHIRSLKLLVKELAVEVASAIQSATDGLFAELGIDLALDKEGKPWVIEVNTKPSKDGDTIRSPHGVRPSAKAIIQFCRSIYESNANM